MDAYDEVRKLAAGGSGRAIVVSPKSGGQKGLLAIKQIACGRDVASANKALFEATTLCTLRHPHVVRFHKVFLETPPGADCSVSLLDQTPPLMPPPPAPAPPWAPGTIVPPPPSPGQNIWTIFMG